MSGTHSLAGELGNFLVRGSFVGADQISRLTGHVTSDHLGASRCYLGQGMIVLQNGLGSFQISLSKCYCGYRGYRTSYIL